MPTDLSIATELSEILASFEHDGEAAIDRLCDLYDRDVTFSDPLQTIRGRDAFLAMNRRILARARHLSFEVTDIGCGRETIFLAWRMLYAPRIGPTFCFDGTTRARTRDGLVVDQRDYWDLLSSFAGSIPVFGRLYASLSSRLG